MGGHAIRGRLAFSIIGAEGDDTISFAARGVNINRGASLTVAAFGREDNDTFSLDYSGASKGLFDCLIDGDEGIDHLRLSARFAANSAPVQKGQLILSGDDADDSLEMSVSGPNALSLSGLIDGGPGRNSCTGSPRVRTRNCGLLTPAVSGPFTKAGPIGGVAVGGRLHL
jgi:hypothetical protein